MELKTFKSNNNETYTNLVVSKLETKGKFFEILDTVNWSFNDDGSLNSYEKVRIKVTEYGEGKDTIFLTHNLDLDRFLSIAQEMAFSQEVTYNEYKGSKNDKYSTGYESRVLDISTFTKNNGNQAYTFKLTHGAGQASANGAVTPTKGSDTKTASIALDANNVKATMVDAYNYFNSKRTAFIQNNYSKIYNKLGGKSA